MISGLSIVSINQKTRFGPKYAQAKDGGLVIWTTYPSPRRKKGKHGECLMMVDRLEKQVMSDKGSIRE